MVGRSINVYQEVDGPVSPIAAPKSVCGIVAAGRGAHIGSVRGPYQSLSECAAEMDNSAVDILKYGHTAAYRWVRDFMKNGARKVYVIEPALTTPASSITYSGTGAGVPWTGKRVFDMITDRVAGDNLVLSPVPGTLSVEHPLATFLVEGVDYIVNYSQGIVYFKTAPANGVQNIRMIFKEYTAANLATSFAIMETVPITIVGAAYAMSDNGGYSLADTIRDHCDFMATRLNPRGGLIAGFYGDVAAIAALAWNNDWLASFANRCGYFNDNLTDPSQTWLEFGDPTARVAGIAAARAPGTSLHDKIVQEANQYDDFTSTNMATLEAAFVNYFQSDGLGNYRIKNGFNYETGTARFRYWDSMQLWIYVANTIYADLETAQLMGNVQIERDQIGAVKNTILFALEKLANESRIGNPKNFELIYKFPNIASQLFDALEKDVSERTAAETAYILAARASRREAAKVYYEDLGWLHYLDVYLGGR